MTRPVEYDNLIEKGAFKPATIDQNSIAQFMRSAEEMLVTSKATTSAAPRFTLAYEGMFNVVMAVLEFHGVRPDDSPGHRVTAIQRVAADLGFDWEKQSALRRLHGNRNRLTYRQSVADLGAQPDAQPPEMDDPETASA